MATIHAKPRIRGRRAKGGNRKVRALRVKDGNFSWASQQISAKSDILSVVYNASDLAHPPKITKGAIVRVDASPFMERYQSTRANVEPALQELFDCGQLLACVSSKPGKCGRADGYVLEGPELNFYLKKFGA